MSAQSLPFPRQSSQQESAVDSVSLIQISQQLSRIEEAMRLLRVPLPSRCLKVKEAADVLGLSEGAVQGLINRGELPGLQMTFGSRKVFRVQLNDLNAFIEAKKKPTPQAEISEQVFTVPGWQASDSSDGTTSP
jgi:excisionase family DNA binding protein